MEVLDFQVEANYDFLTVNGAQYSGSTNPHGVITELGTITWSSDYSVVMTGFKICPKALGPCDT